MRDCERALQIYFSLARLGSEAVYIKVREDIDERLLPDACHIPADLALDNVETVGCGGQKRKPFVA